MVVGVICRERRMYMKCPYCGEEVDKDDAFCGECGNYIKKEKQRFPVVIVAIVVLAAVVGGTGLGFIMKGYIDSGKKISPNLAETNSDTEESGLNEQEKSILPDETQENNTEFNNSNEEGEEAFERIDIMGNKNGYILSESNTKFLADEDISGMTLQEINYAKNEIYARHGRKFASEELQKYFDSKSWYTGKYEPGDFDENYSSQILNEYEKANAEFLREIEYSISAEGYQLDMQ